MPKKAYGTLLVSTITTLITVYILLMQFLRSPDRLMETRIEIYRDLSFLVGRTLASDRNKINYNDSLKYFSFRFEQIYWGYGPIIADDSVKNKMRRFKNILKDRNQGKISTDTLVLVKAGEDLLNSCKINIIKLEY